MLYAPTVLLRLVLTSSRFTRIAHPLLVQPFARQTAREDKEAKEAERQDRKLNFLITQTELYAHFMRNKMKLQDKEVGV